MRDVLPIKGEVSSSNHMDRMIKSFMASKIWSKADFRLKSHIFHSDRIYINLCIFYILFPVIIFFIGFLKLLIALPICVLTLYCWARFDKSFRYLNSTDFQISGEYSKISGIKNGRISSNVFLFFRFDNPGAYWLITLALSLLWVFFSGVGGYSFQNEDHLIRNAVFNDLINFHWPVIYDLSKMDSQVTAVIGTDKVALVYYLTYWMPAAVIGKVLGFEVARFSLFLWTVFGIMLVVFLITRYLGKRSYLAWFMLMGFSGLDVISGLLSGVIKVDFITHIERWAGIFEYTSNTSQLYWVFNQALPVWLIMMLLLNCRNGRNAAFLGSMTFCYSPFATIGIIPYVAYFMMKKDEGENTIIDTDRDKRSVLSQIREAFWTALARLKQNLTLQNILMPGILLLVYAPFYTSNKENLAIRGWVFNLVPMERHLILMNYLLFVILEVGVFFVLVFKDMKRASKGLLVITILELSLIPFYKMSTTNDFVMRASIPALFLLMIMMFLQLLSRKGPSRLLVIIVLTIGLYTPITEINRSVWYTIIKNDQSVAQSISLGDIQNSQKKFLELWNTNYFAHGYQETFFFQVLSKGIGGK